MITIAGATGKTGSGIADILLEKGERVRAIGRSAERL
ncbi:MAG: NmrA family NAD(P)-binding protein [Chitinispirillaceae bacterium]|nr:NmrA family NAD(P)-binding protein [Chitinispirillaceae bacterium]